MSQFNLKRIQCLKNTKVDFINIYTLKISQFKKYIQVETGSTPYYFLKKTKCLKKVYNMYYILQHQTIIQGDS